MMDRLHQFDVYREVFQSDKAKEFLTNFFEVTGVFQSSFVLNDPTATAFNEGKRAAGLFLLNVLNQNKELVAKYSQQAQEQQQLNNILKQERILND